MPNIVIRNIEAVIQESIRKVTAWASHGGGVLKSELRMALESQRTKRTAVRGLRLYSIIISKYYTPAVRGLRLWENVHLTAANINLTKL